MSQRDGPPPKSVFTPTPAAATNIIERIDKLDRILQRVGTRVEDVPVIRRDVEGTSRSIVALDTKLEHIQDRVGKVEKRIDRPHECVKAPVIDQLSDGHKQLRGQVEADGRQNVKTLQMITAVREDAETVKVDIKSINQGRKEWTRIGVGILVTVLSAAGSGLWFVSRLSTRVSHNESTQQERYGTLQRQLESMPTKGQQQELQQEVEQLRRALDRAIPAGYDDLSALCRDKTPTVKRRIRRQLLQLNLDVPQVCRED